MRLTMPIYVLSFGTGFAARDGVCIVVVFLHKRGAVPAFECPIISMRSAQGGDRNNDIET